MLFDPECASVRLSRMVADFLLVEGFSSIEAVEGSSSAADFLTLTFFLLVGMTLTVPLMRGI